MVKTLVSKDLEKITQAILEGKSFCTTPEILVSAMKKADKLKGNDGTRNKEDH